MEPRLKLIIEVIKLLFKFDILGICTIIIHCVNSLCGGCKAASLMADFAIGGTMLDGCFYPRSLLFLYPSLLFCYSFAPSSTQTTTQKKAEPLSDSA